MSIDKKNRLLEDLNISSAANESLHDAMFNPNSTYDDRREYTKERMREADAKALLE